VKKKYNHLPMIDVVNEAIDGHQAANPLMKESLGGGGKTGYDWLIKAFEMAGERYIKIHMIENNAVACLNVSYVDCISDNNDRMVTTIEAFDWELTVNETPEKIYNMLQKAVKSNEETSTVK
jgi:hypothetical protein